MATTIQRMVHDTERPVVPRAEAVTERVWKLHQTVGDSSAHRNTHDSPVHADQEPGDVEHEATTAKRIRLFVSPQACSTPSLMRWDDWSIPTMVST